MVKKRQCVYCLISYQGNIPPNWGSSSDVRVVPACYECHNRYQAKVRDLEGKLASLESELENRKEKHDAALSNLVAESETAKTEYESRMSEMNNRSVVAINKLEAELESNHTKMTFLKVCRDALQGDVVLRVQRKYIMANRAFLASKSSVFRKLFESDTPENPTRFVQIAKASFPVIEALVNFCYTGEISFTEFVPPAEVLKSAHTYNIEHLRDVCDSELCARINMDNLPQLLKLSWTCAASRLQDETAKYFQEHIYDLEDRVYKRSRIEYFKVLKVRSTTATLATSIESSPV